MSVLDQRIHQIQTPSTVLGESFSPVEASTRSPRMTIGSQLRYQVWGLHHIRSICNGLCLEEYPYTSAPDYHSLPGQSWDLLRSNDAVSGRSSLQCVSQLAGKRAGTYLASVTQIR